MCLHFFALLPDIKLHIAQHVQLLSCKNAPLNEIALYHHRNPRIAQIPFVMSKLKLSVRSIVARRYPNLSQCGTQLFQFSPIHLPNIQIN